MKEKEMLDLRDDEFKDIRNMVNKLKDVAFGEDSKFNPIASLASVTILTENMLQSWIETIENVGDTLEKTGSSAEGIDHICNLHKVSEICGKLASEFLSVIHNAS